MHLTIIFEILLKCIRLPCNTYICESFGMEVYVCISSHDNLKTIADICFLLGSDVD